jgi:hypothetical protein
VCVWPQSIEEDGQLSWGPAQGQHCHTAPIPCPCFPARVSLPVFPLLFSEFLCPLLNLLRPLAPATDRPPVPGPHLCAQPVSPLRFEHRRRLSLLSVLSGAKAGKKSPSTATKVTAAAGGSTPWNFSQVDLPEFDRDPAAVLAKFPRFKKARRLVVEVNAGECLYIPAGECSSACFCGAGVCGGGCRCDCLRSSDGFLCARAHVRACIWWLCICICIGMFSVCWSAFLWVHIALHMWVCVSVRMVP